MSAHIPIVQVSRQRMSAVVAVTLIAGAALALAFVAEPERAAISYLIAFVFWLSVALGLLAMVMIHHTTDSTWFIVLRRTAEAGAASLVALAFLFIPIAFTLNEIFVWVAPDALTPSKLLRQIHEKDLWLNVPFFLGRAATYFAIWGATALLLWWMSVRQDSGDHGKRLARGQRTVSVVALPFATIALTLASFDWMVSLEPVWDSSIFGYYYFAGAALAAVAVLILVFWAHARLAGDAALVTISHFHALGKLLFVFTLFWAYISFCQYMLVWIAGLPDEQSWYVHRTAHGWAGVFVALVLGQFVIPFLVLLRRAVRRVPGALAAVAAWSLAFHYLDLYWVVVPACRGHDCGFYWADPVAFIAIGGVAYLTSLLFIRGRAEAPAGDPRLEKSLSYETS